MTLMCLLCLWCHPMGDPMPAQPYWLALSVADVEATATWYQTHLGFTEFERMDLPQRDMYLRFLKRGHFTLELAQRGDAVTVSDHVKVSKKSQVRGYYKWGLLVEDLDTFAEKLRAADVRFHGEVFDDPRFGVRTVVVADNEGNLVQLFEKASAK